MENEDQTPFWLLAKHGIALLLNNKQEEADALFRKHPDNITMYSGYATSLFMDALMTFEDEKLNLATHTLKETEKKCATVGWFRPLKHGKNQDSDISYADHLETQIIRADSQMYLATLTFLQQDISAYFKGGWVLRKSWKHYQQTYNEISTLYKKIVGEPMTAEAAQSTDLVSSTIDVAEEAETPKSPVIDISSEMEIFDKNELLNGEQSSRPVTPEDNKQPQQIITRNGYIPKSSTMHFPPGNDPAPSTTNQNSVLKKSQSVNSSLEQFQRGFSRFSPFNGSLSYIASLNPFSAEGVKPIEIDKETITRLMCGVSFGYGLLQLGMSLLPPSILKLTNFLGFQGNRKGGLANLMQARNGTDMRAPLATLALLWYHTIVRPFFALDGNNVQAGVQIASKLIDDAMKEYSNSCIFLFFKGRVDRLKSDIPAAIISFNASVANSNQREIKILSRHEVGWCYLIELDFDNALITFLYLKQQSRWSRSFYTYLCTVSAGSNGTLEKINNIDEFAAIFSTCPTGSQLDEFMARRFKICPKNGKDLLDATKEFWRLLSYELLYLWNSLPSCNFDNVELIINDCEQISKEEIHEPFVGLSHLIAGSSHCILKNYDMGIQCFRACLKSRETASRKEDDHHISAFALYELGQLLIRNPETKLEGKQCLQHVQSFKDYDFEQRLSVRIHSILKHL